jgi:hypothetical protein
MPRGQPLSTMSVNVWYGIRYNELTDLFICSVRLTGDIYNFCTVAYVIYTFGNTAASVLGENEAPANFYRAVKTYKPTSHPFNGRWIDRVGLKTGPRTSPYHSSLYFYP